MSRISTFMITQRSIDAMLRQQGKVSDTQQQISTGRRVLTPSDDPASAARVLNLNGALGTVQQYLNNADRAQSRLETEEGVLVGVGNALQRANELAIQGNNAPLSVTDKQAVAAEVRQLQAQILALANTRDSGGEYMFSGYQTGTKPFSQPSLGSFSYAGDAGQRRLQISPDRQIADGDTGFDLFMNVATGPVATVNGVATTALLPLPAIDAGDITLDGGNGNGPISLGAIPAAADPAMRAAQIRDAINRVTAQTGVRAVDGGADNVVLTAVEGSGISIGLAGTADTANTGLSAGHTPTTTGKRSIFETVHLLAAALEQGQPVDRYIADIQLALGHVIDTRSSVGARLNAIDEQIEVNLDLELVLEKHKSQEQDLDYAEAIARFERQMTALQAAQQSYVKIKSLSLFNYL